MHESRTVGQNAAWKRDLRRRLFAWYRTSARELPWRKTRDPYRVWLSEIMLQQTQVVSVIPYFERFLERFPDVVSLAEADEQEVLRLWEGLGYYRRARQLHKAANVIAAEHHARFPQDFDAVLALPGIGRYTAGAILSIAFDQRRPIVEANSTRVLCRLAAYRGEASSSAGQRFLWQLAENLLPKKSAGAFNQALMELGSQVCTPRRPRCQECPVAVLCHTNRQGLQESIPVAKKPQRDEDVREAAVVVRRRDRVLLRLRGDGERWAGMWDFPRFVLERSRGAALQREIAAKTADLTGLSIETGRRFATIKHGVTRFRITLDCYLARCASGRLRRNGGPMVWLRPETLAEYPLSVTGRQIGRLLLESD